MPPPIMLSFLSLLLLLFPRAMKAGEDAPGHHRLRGRSLQAPAPCDLLTRSAFDALAPGAQSPPYSYDAFCAAATGWNAANPAQQIFTTGTEEDQRDELAAFIGHALHESGDFVHPRELSQCSAPAVVNGDLYCRPDGFASGAYDDPYCDPRGLTPGTDPDGCACSAVGDDVVAGRLRANLLFFGRGPMQLSWNYNYIDAGNALGVDLCAEPELASSDEAIAWGTAIWFWMQNTGATGVTPHDAILTNGDFGASLNTINGGLECPAASAGSVTSRLDDYCRAANALGLASLLSFGGCDGLEARFTECLGASTCPNCEGFGDTITSPSKSPTKVPTKTPSTSPTDTPTISPTANPPKSPSISPTEAPATSANPTASPVTSTPSGSPTRASSKSPSTSPAEAPTISPTTSAPSVSPTRAPLKSPSTQPTKAPTTSPSMLAPSVSPSQAPSKSPLTPPTKAPAASPITPRPSGSPTPSPSKSPLIPPTKSPTTSPSTPAPSVSPTSGPTRSPAPCLFYTNGLTCVNDCNEESWNTMHGTLEECCAEHHGYAGPGGFTDCAGITESPSTSPTANPSKSPSTMAPTRSPNTSAPSVSPSPAPTQSPSPCSFYTNWDTCVNDCSEEVWDTLHNTREECCSAHHSYGGTGGYADCMGITESPTTSPTANPSKSPSTMAPTQSPNTPAPSVPPAPAPTRSPSPCLFYTNWRTCVNDCNEEGWNTLYDTLGECCARHHNWLGAGGYADCMVITGSPTMSPTGNPPTSPSSMAPTESPNTPKPSVSPTPAPTQSPNPCLFYTNWRTCINDCNEEGWDTLHDSLEECCSAHHGYGGTGGYADCMGITESPTTSPTANPSTSLPTVVPTRSPNSPAPSISPTAAPAGSPSPCSFYTNWRTCVDDCNEKAWNTLHDTREKCCLAHHGYGGTGGYVDCMGTALSPGDTSSFYVDWNTGKCVQNCEVALGVPCGGIRQESYIQKHEDVQQCCQAHLGYLCPEPGIPCAACTDADISAWTNLFN